ncbi:MAG: hypothetical protein HY554_11710 [Elusimicrobia bacterium]|nr:hypothetical protein [Elusimicrobiota bacterium]
MLAAALFSGCARMPYFKRWAKKPYLPYLESKLFSFEHPRAWQPVRLPDGAEVRDPDGGAVFSVEFLPLAHPAYKPPKEYRRDMAAWGAIEDKHLVYEIELSSRPAYRVLFTTYEYDARYLLGEKVRVESAELTLVPDERGLFLVKYRAPRGEFDAARNRAQYARFLENLVLSAPKPK